MSSQFQKNFREANKDFIRITSNIKYPAHIQAILINKMRTEIENTFDIDEFYHNKGNISLNIQKEAIDWENKHKSKYEKI